MSPWENGTAKGESVCKQRMSWHCAWTPSPSAVGGTPDLSSKLHGHRITCDASSMTLVQPRRLVVCKAPIYKVLWEGVCADIFVSQAGSWDTAVNGLDGSAAPSDGLFCLGVKFVADLALCAFHA